MRILDENDFLDMDNGETRQFLYCNAHVTKDGDIWNFYSYSTLMAKIFTGKYGLLVVKESNYTSVTTLQHLRKFFNMIGANGSYYTFKHMDTHAIMEL
mgnify:CR=1 FL=1